MTLGIMQPYFFPYIGYWQLLSAVDRFVIYDDVNYIKGGWVNRNRILVNGAPSWITVPIAGMSPFKRICDLTSAGGRWRERMLRTVQAAYRRAPYFREIYPAISPLIANAQANLSAYLAESIVSVAKLLSINTEIVVTSRKYGNDDLHGQPRVLDICARERATRYVNAEGGQALYQASSFRSAGVELEFLTSTGRPYAQRKTGFVPNLSIIDMLMEIGIDGVHAQLDAFQLIAPL
jgi:hypothetical protein